ncbi:MULTISPECIES: DUF6894 family protein [Microvirga]|uniref:DUF6894 family protein n=1 Tax=Microvirga TaxID=186650 RepID=UPI001CFF58C7|nr:hypothetical protein [Microvirga lenta]MCB5177461.1 hypothetical protein [Microvirga lenta]
MPLYYVNIVRKDAKTLDLEGVNLRDDAAAMKYALADAVDLIAQGILDQDSIKHYHLEVVDGTGRMVTMISLKDVAGR